MSASTGDLPHAAARAKAWLLEACFPFWAQRGPDPRGGFRERLTLEGGLLQDDVSRVRVQARQTYVFAQAKLMGWRPDESDALMQRGVDALLAYCRRPDGLFGKLVRLGEGLADDAPELYDNAFALFGFSWAARATGRADYLQAATDTLSAIETHLARADGGYHNTLPPTRPRLQNPHMHMFEALLALHAASGDQAHLEKARAMGRLCREHFFQPEEGRLRERFHEDWTPSESTEDAIIEPGHELEWAWMWGKLAARTNAPLEPVAQALYRAGCSALTARGLAPQSVHVDGRLVDASRRTWPQTEALKAHLTMVEHGGGAEALSAALRTFDALFEDYLDPAPTGGWIDHYDAEDQPLVDSMTAATGYHVVCAMAEVISVADAVSDGRIQLTPGGMAVQATDTSDTTASMNAGVAVNAHTESR